MDAGMQAAIACLLPLFVVVLIAMSLDGLPKFKVGCILVGFLASVTIASFLGMVWVVLAQ